MVLTCCQIIIIVRGENTKQWRNGWTFRFSTKRTQLQIMCCRIKPGQVRSLDIALVYLNEGRSAWL